MPDREKVIKTITRIRDDYFWEMASDDREALDAAIDLLKAQENTVCTKERCPVNANSISDDCNVKTCPWRTEAVKPRLSMSGLWYECPVCNRHLTKFEDHYCARCGKAVEWDG